jgi:hypothetical protein
LAALDHHPAWRGEYGLACEAQLLLKQPTDRIETPRRPERKRGLAKPDISAACHFFKFTGQSERFFE